MFLIKIYLKNITIYFRTAAESAAGADSEGPHEAMPSNRLATSVQDTTIPAASWFHDYCTPALSIENKLYAAQQEFEQLKGDLAKHRDSVFFF